jgi:hypothetical protein
MIEVKNTYTIKILFIFGIFLVINKSPLRENKQASKRVEEQGREGTSKQEINRLTYK